MSGRLGSEDAAVEQPALRLLAELGWEVLSGLNDPDELGRSSQSEPVLRARLQTAIQRLNPGLDAAAIDSAIETLINDRSSLDPVRANRDVWTLLRDGVVVQAEGAHGEKEPRRVRYISWEVSDDNEWLAVSQLWLTGDLHRRRADIVLFVNGIPLGFIELKAPDQPVLAAYQDNLRAYRSEIPQLFWFNGFVILSNGSESRMGSAYAPWEHFAEWKKISDESEPGVVSLETMLRATCDRPRMLDLVENFTVFTERPQGLVKAVAKNHQYLGVNNAIEALHQVESNQGRLGVFWHTQGSGKSLSMLWFCQKVLRKRPGNWTFVLVTDRKELDDQLYEEFADSSVITAGARVHAESSAHLRELLGTDQRYVFTLIHKFIPPERNAEMPVLSERDDIIVITDEAHRSQYDTLAGNMRKALPNASFLGFTGTPLIDGEEEETRRVFGDYVSTYNFADSIRDGATVPLYYENRIPELQLENENFDAELEELLSAPDLDDAQERAISRRFAKQHQLITRPKRLEEIAADLVHHFANRGFLGKGMFVAIDKATAVRMHGLVAAEWSRYILRLEARLDTLPILERAPVEYQIRWMRETDMAVIVSQAQNEVEDMAALGLDIVPHRRRMNDEDLDSRFKDPSDPFRLVFVCAMWLTGFDAPSTSTVYLDKPMRGHTLMQTIARANRVFPDKEAGLIVDYIGVFRNLEKALAIYGVDREGAVGSPIQPTDDLRSQLAKALAEVEAYLDENDVDLADLGAARGFEFVALLDSAVESLLIEERIRKRFVTLANQARKAYKSLMPDPEAIRATERVAVIRSLSNKLASLGEVADISDVMDGVSDLLDRSVGTKEYIIRAAGEEQALLDLNQIDFEQLAFTFAQNKRTAAKAVERALGRDVEQAVRENPTYADLADKFRRLIDDYNAGTLNADEFLRRARRLKDTLDERQNRAVAGELSKAELAIFDLLTKPAPELSDGELKKVQAAAKQLLARIEDILVLDWKKKQQSRSLLRREIATSLDNDLPGPYGPEMLREKTEDIYEHVFASYMNDLTSVYDTDGVPDESGTVVTVPETAVEVTDELLARLRADDELFAEAIQKLYGTTELWALPTPVVLETDETDLVEYKTSARWDTDRKVTRKAPAVITKTIAGFANAAGGTLLIGVRDDRTVTGLQPDYETFGEPQDADQWLNWLTDIIIANLGRVAISRLRIRMEKIEGREICRIDVPASHRPIWEAGRKGKQILWERLPNSTRQVPADELDAFLADRFGGGAR
ncbi:MAG: HsdR family type I site-specific deoxyribonuclease [Acidimicrobiales bacterium]